MTEDPFRITGTVIDGRYRIDAVVGEGGFGVVYRAFHVGFKAPIAVKVLKVPRDLKPSDRANFLATFDAEGNLLFQLAKRHPGFVQVTEKGIIDREDGQIAPYLVLEWLDGETLELDLDRRRSAGKAGRDLAQTIACLKPIAEALGIAHAQKVAHRDIKPPNIFLARTDEGVTAKLLDFGIAKVMTATGSAALREPTMKGVGGFTMEYGAPEQWNRKYGATGPWTDVFALALVCVEMLTGKPALQGDEPGQFFGATIDPTDRPTPSSRGASVSPQVDQVFRKALAIAPADRYPDARAFWDALIAAADVVPAISQPWGTLTGPTIISPMPPPSLPTVPMLPYAVTAPPGGTRKVPASLVLRATLVLGLGVLVMLGIMIKKELTQEGAAIPASAIASEAKAPPTPSATPTASASESDSASAPRKLWGTMPTPSSTVAPEVSVVPRAAVRKPEPGFLTIVCNPYCDDVIDRGTSLGPSPIVHQKVDPGAHRITLKRGSTIKVIAVVVESGQLAAQRVDMRDEQLPPPHITVPTF